MFVGQTKCPHNEGSPSRAGLHKNRKSSAHTHTHKAKGFTWGQPHLSNGLSSTWLVSLTVATALTSSCVPLTSATHNNTVKVKAEAACAGSMSGLIPSPKQAQPPGESLQHYARHSLQLYLTSALASSEGFNSLSLKKELAWESSNKGKNF